LAIVFQALLFAWHHHDLHLAAPHAPSALSAIHGDGHLSPGDDEDGCQICMVLHHQSTSTADVVALPPHRAAVSVPRPAESVIVGLSFSPAFHSRAPPVV
jgi:hypothetical protein